MIKRTSVALATIPLAITKHQLRLPASLLVHRPFLYLEPAARQHPQSPAQDISDVTADSTPLATRERFLGQLSVGSF